MLLSLLKQAAGRSSVISSRLCGGHPLANWLPRPRALIGCCRAIYTSVDADEIASFERLSADEWWDEFGPMRALHSLNALRVPLVSQSLPLPQAVGPLPRIVDVGCGVGILSEPLARLGLASVLGIDPSPTLIDHARMHQAQDLSLHQAENLEYSASSVEDLLEQGEESMLFDVVVASEIVEHVTSDPARFIASCCALVKPGGHLVLTTLNRTWLSQVLAIWLAESPLLGLVPPGTHDWDKFITPRDLTLMVEQGGQLGVTLLHGMTYNPLRNRWAWTANTDINYALVARRRIPS